MNFFKRFQSSRDSYLITALVVGIVLLVNMVAARHFVRTDLTKTQLYSISDASRGIMRGLEDIVTVKLYFSETLPPNLFAVRQYVDDILEELTSYSRGRLLVQSQNPSDPAMMQEALKLGIPQIQMIIIEKDQLQVKNGFLGIAILYGDKKEILPVVQNTLNLEYDLVASIKKVAAKEEKVVGIVTGHDEPTLEEKMGVGQTGESLAILKKSLERNYRVLSVDLNQKDALNGVHTVLVAGSEKAFTDVEKFKLDQFLMKGGNAVFFLDSVMVQSDLTTSMASWALSDLLANYGLGIEKSLALDRSNENASFNQGFMNFIVPYPFWVKALNRFMDTSTSVVAKLDSVVFPWISPLKTLSVEGGTTSVLIKTTPNAWVQSEPFSLAPDLNQAAGEKSQYPLAMMTSGSFTSFYKGKENPPGEDELIVEKSEKPTRIILVGNSRFILDRFVNMFPQNLAFAMNVIDDLTLDQSLIGIRSKTIFDLPLKELTAGERQIVKMTGVFLMPILVITYGILRYFWRRRHIAPL